MEEKLLKDKKELREALDSEQLDLNKRLDKLNLDRMSDVADIQSKMQLVGKSASRHLETLRAQLFRECQTLFELATKPCSIGNAFVPNAILACFHLENISKIISTSSSHLNLKTFLQTGGKSSFFCILRMPTLNCKSSEKPPALQ